MTEPIATENKHAFAPYLRHYGKTVEEQIEKNKPLMEWLKQKIEEAENLTEEEVQVNHEYLEELKATIDSFRPTGHKLFSENLNELESLVDFLPVTQEVWRKAAQLWAESRRQGQPTADSKNIDADVIIAATCQILQAEYPGQSFVVATTNVKHLSHFVMAQTWQEIR
jgi:predicted nucleic acid-binding protein